MLVFRHPDCSADQRKYPRLKRFDNRHNFNTRNRDKLGKVSLVWNYAADYLESAHKLISG